jgi:hypothetical protein
LNTTLAVIGLVFVGAAVVGGGLKALGIEVPLLASRSRQLLLVVVGSVAFVVALVAPQLNSENQGSSKASPPGDVSPGARVEIIRPGVGTTMQAGGDVSIAGTVTGLAGDFLWVVFRPEVDDSGLYYLAQSGPVTDHDGAWQFVSEQVGDSTDKGHHITFIALQANGSCHRVLSSLPPDSNGWLSFTAIPDGCVDCAERSVSVAQ